jgi:hypothetical protein
MQRSLETVRGTTSSNAKSVAEQRVALAGARLAALLNTALAAPGGGGTPTVATPPVVTPTATGADVFINHNGHAYHLATCRYVGRNSRNSA